MRFGQCARMTRRVSNPLVEKKFWDNASKNGVKKRITGFERFLLSLDPSPPNISDRLMASLGNIKNLKICELGCGSGRLTVELANRGAFVSSVDISRKALQKAQIRIREAGLESRVNLWQMDACNLSYKDEMFDLVVGQLILHHLDITKTTGEICRILKLGGKAVFIEPLSHNPLSNIWRKMTPAGRTPTEWPLSYGEIEEMGRSFSSMTFEESYLLPLLSSCFYLFTHSPKAKKKVGVILSKLDPSLLRRCKFLRRLCAIILIQLIK